MPISEENLVIGYVTTKLWSTPFKDEADKLARKCKEFIIANLQTADDVFIFLQEIHEKHSSAECEAIQELLRTIAVEMKKEAIHKGISCDGCNLKPILGVRYKCQVCHDFDLCTACYMEPKHLEHQDAMKPIYRSQR